MDFSAITFKRKFSMSMYKDLKLMLGKMTFTKDFVQDRRGDLYPVLDKSDNCEETIADNTYTVSKGNVKRMFCQFFPYATYEMTAENIGGTVGFCFRLPGKEIFIGIQDSHFVFRCGDKAEFPELPDDLSASASKNLIVSCRPGAFDIYVRRNGAVQYWRSFTADEFADSNTYGLFSDGYAAVYVSGNAVIREVLAYIDNGISQADLRPIRYENGDIMLDQGKIYLTASIRLEVGTFQGIFSWIPGTAEFQLTGALFYDAGDGKWCGDVAASVLYHREEKRYYLWVCSFSHGHILGHSVFDGELRFGVNVVDIQLMDSTLAGEDGKTDITAFAGRKGDEDPDFFYDTENKKWLMAICRIDPAINSYRYVFFESKQPFEGYTYLGKGLDGAETGGSFVKVGGEQLFVCGNDFHAVSDYRIYDKTGMQTAKFNFPDGGFRGWGTLMPVKLGSRTRHFWITFDRHNGSDYNWSYGNLYCFEGKI